MLSKLSRENVFDFLLIPVMLGFVFLIGFQNWEGFIQFIQKGDRFLGDFTVSYYKEAEIIFTTKRAVIGFLYSCTFAGFFGLYGFFSQHTAETLWLVTIFSFSVFGILLARNFLKHMNFHKNWYYLYVALYYTNYCFWINVFFGQVDEILFVFFLCFLYFIRVEKLIKASCAVALLVTTKYYYVIILLPLLIRKYWILLIRGAFLSLSIMFLIPLVWMSPSEMFRFYQDVFSNVQFHMPYYFIDTSNQSLAATISQYAGPLTVYKVVPGQLLWGTFIFMFWLKMKKILPQKEYLTRILMVGYATAPFVFSPTGWVHSYIINLMMTFVIFKDVQNSSRILKFAVYSFSLIYYTLTNVLVMKCYYEIFGYYDLYYKLAEMKLYITYTLCMSSSWFIHYYFLSVNDLSLETKVHQIESSI